MVLREIINKGAITMDHIHSNTIEDVRTPGRHLSLEERGMIQALHRQGFLQHRCRRMMLIRLFSMNFWRGTPDRKASTVVPPAYGKARSEGLCRQRIARTPGSLCKIDHDDCELFIQWMVERVQAGTLVTGCLRWLCARRNKLFTRNRLLYQDALQHALG